MKSIIISPKTKKEFDLINDLLTALKIKSFDLSVDDKEELAFSKMLSGVDRSKKVKRETVMKNLKKK